MRMLPAEILRRDMMPDDQIRNAVYQLGTEIQVDVALINIPAHGLSDGIITWLKANLLQELIDRDLQLIPHPLVQVIFRLSDGFNI